MTRIGLFFFSSRRRHTRLVSDWSSDVCSSDLAADSEIVLRLHDAFQPELEDHQLVRLLETIELPLMPVLVDMESRGVCIDLTRLGEISRAFAGELTALERAIYHAAGDRKSTRLNSSH